MGEYRCWSWGELEASWETAHRLARTLYDLQVDAGARHAGGDAHE